jgi:hypothetical protein
MNEELFVMQNKNASERWDFPLFPQDLPYLRATSIQVLEDCKKSWAARFLLGLGDEEPLEFRADNIPAKVSAGEIGTANHLIIEQCLQHALEIQAEGKVPNIYHCLNEIIPKHPALGWIKKPEERENLIDYVGTRLFDEGETILEIEVEDTIIWNDEEPPIKMHVDLIKYKGDTLIIQDHKTNRSYEPWEVWAKKIQQCIYGMAVRRRYPQFARLKWVIGYVNQKRNVVWYSDPEDDIKIVDRITRLWNDVVHIEAQYRGDISKFPETPHKNCDYCPIKHNCDAYKSMTIDFEISRSRLLPMSLGDRLAKLKLVRDFVDAEISAVEGQVRDTLSLGNEVINTDGTRYILHRPSKRRVEFLSSWNAILEYCDNCPEVWPDVYAMLGDLTTMKVTAIDKLIKKYPDLKKRLAPFIISQEAETPSIKLKDSED